MLLSRCQLLLPRFLLRNVRYEFVGVVNQELKLARDFVGFTNRLKQVVPGFLEQPLMLAKVFYELGKLP